MNTLVAIQKDITVLARPEKAELYRRYFKTDVGQYSEGDAFLGVTVPDCRHIAKHYHDQSEFRDLLNLLASQWHEYRLVALMMLVEKVYPCKWNATSRNL